jgi:toxin HigB-1
MIRNYKNSKTEKVHNTGAPKGFKGLDGKRALKVLNILAAANTLNDLPRLASYRLHKLGKDRKGQWSITVNLPWVVCFTPTGEGFADVEIVDYH